jgi:hypothetical protein
VATHAKESRSGDDCFFLVFVIRADDTRPHAATQAAFRRSRANPRKTKPASYEGFCCTANKTPAKAAGVIEKCGQGDRLLIFAIMDDGRNIVRSRMAVF